MATATSDGAAQIREVIEKRVQAVRAKDVEGAMACVAPEIQTFDVIVPLRHQGAASVRERAATWFASFEGPIGFEMRDLTIAAGADVAFAYSLNRYSGTLKSGDKIDMWVRSTLCLQRIQGRWLITHEHGSVPFDPKSGEASLDLQP